MKGLRAWAQPLVVGALVGLLPAACAMYAAWQHNPQEEFHGAGGVRWGEWLSIGASWFVVFALPVALVVRLTRGSEPPREPRRPG